MIRRVGATIGRAVLNGIGRATSRFQESRSLSVDLLESDDAYLAVFDAPGATAADIAVRFEGNMLSVRIDRFRAFYDGYEMVFPGRGLGLKGTVNLPEGASVDADNADATLTRTGTLEVLIPKVDDTGAKNGSDASTEVEPSTESASKTDGDASDKPSGLK